MDPREMATAFGDQSIVVSRTFDAPREALFEAFTDPTTLARWFAPEPLTVPRAEVDLRVGGRQTIVMRDGNGTDYTSTGVYKEVDRPSKLVMTDSIAQMPSEWLDLVNKARGEEPGAPIPDGLVTVTFEDEGGQTKLTYREDFDSKATRDAFVEMQMIEGLQGSFNNLDKVLAKTATMAR